MYMLIYMFYEILLWNFKRWTKLIVYGKLKKSTLIGLQNLSRIVLLNGLFLLNRSYSISLNRSANKKKKIMICSFQNSLIMNVFNLILSVNKNYVAEQFWNFLSAIFKQIVISQILIDRLLADFRVWHEQNCFSKRTFHIQIVKIV